jgi:hypothetical protein
MKALKTMQTGLTALKVLVLMVVAVVVSGCIGTRYAHIDFQHKDIVHKDAPYTFVVEETVIKDFTRGGLGNWALLSRDYTAEVSNCIAHAIRDKFPDVNVIVSKDIGKTKKENLPGNLPVQALQTGVAYIHNIADFSIKPGFAHNFVTRFTADIETDKGSFSINAVGKSGGFPLGGSTKESTEKACKDFAEKLNDSLKNR